MAAEQPVKQSGQHGSASMNEIVYSEALVI